MTLIGFLFMIGPVFTAKNVMENAVAIISTFVSLTELISSIMAMIVHAFVIWSMGVAPFQDHAHVCAHVRGLVDKRVLAFWTLIGHQHAKGEDVLPKAMLSKECLCTATKLHHVEIFYRQIAPLIQTVVQVFAAVDRTQYQRYLANYQQVALSSPLRLLQTSHRALLLGIGASSKSTGTTPS